MAIGTRIRVDIGIPYHHRMYRYCNGRMEPRNSLTLTQIMCLQSELRAYHTGMLPFTRFYLWTRPHAAICMGKNVTAASTINNGTIENIVCEVVVAVLLL